MIANPGRTFYGLLIFYPLFHFHRFQFVGQEKYLSIKQDSEE